MRSLSKGLKLFLVIIVYAFMVIPLLYTLLFSFTSADTFQISGFSFRWYIQALDSPAFMNALKSSLIVALLATTIALCLSFLVAFATFKSKKLKKINFLYDAPFVFPHIVLSLILFQLLVVSLGIDDYIVLVLAHVVVLLPYMIRYLTAILLKLDYNIYLAARTLGMKDSKIVRKVILPNISSSIVAVSLISFINSFNNLSISYFLIKPGMNLLPKQMLSYLEQNYEPVIASLSVIIILCTLIIVIFIEKFLKFSLIEKE